MFSHTEFLVRYLRPQGWKAALLAVCLLGGVALQLYTPQVVRSFIDLAAARGEARELSLLALTYLALAFANQGLSAAGTYLSADVGWSATNALRADLFGHALRLDMAYHKDRTPGEMIERIDGDVTGISNFFSQFVVRVTGVVFSIWQMTVVVGLVSPRNLSRSWRLHHKLKRKRTTKKGALYRKLTDCLFDRPF